MNNGGSRFKLRDPDKQGVSEQSLTFDERDSREVVRGWEQCCPIDKWQIAFPHGPAPPALSEQGTEVVEGKRVKVGYFLKLRDPRPFCYDICQRHTDAVNRSRVLMDIHDDDNEGRESTMDDAQSVVLQTFADKTKVSLTRVEAALSGMVADDADPVNPTGGPPIKTEIDGDEEEEEEFPQVRNSFQTAMLRLKGEKAPIKSAGKALAKASRSYVLF